jgi:hypothetical protein
MNKIKKRIKIFKSQFSEMKEISVAGSAEAGTVYFNLIFENPGIFHGFEI